VKPRLKAKTDDNQQEIMDALRAAGAEVTSLHQLGQGVPDLLVSFRGVWHVAEVKSDVGHLTDPQNEWIDKQKAVVYVWHTPAEALRDIGLSPS